MGAWGYGPFENDDALDFVADLETTTGTGHLSTVLSAIADDRSENVGRRNRRRRSLRPRWSPRSWGIHTQSFPKKSPFGLLSKRVLMRTWLAKPCGRWGELRRARNCAKWRKRMMTFRHGRRASPI